MPKNPTVKGKKALAPIASKAEVKEFNELKLRQRSSGKFVSNPMEAMIQVILSPNFGHWNAHLPETDLNRLIDDAKSGKLDWQTSFSTSMPVLAPYAPSKGNNGIQQIYCQVV